LNGDERLPRDPIVGGSFGDEGAPEVTGQTPSAEVSPVRLVPAMFETPETSSQAAVDTVPLLQNVMSRRPSLRGSVEGSGRPPVEGQVPAVQLFV